MLCNKCAIIFILNVLYIFLYLSNHDREDKNTNKVVDELEDHLKQGGGFWDTSNSNQGLHSIVVTANITEQRERGYSKNKSVK